LNFSDRTPGDLSPNPIAQALERAQGRPLLDLTESNPTCCGFDYPPDLLQALNRPEGLLYEPHPFGHPKARQAVADYLASKGQKADPSHVVLTASTSEAYSYLFKLLGNPGDSFLVPTPGYPLLDHLIRLEGMELVPYSLKAEPGWPVDLKGLEKSLQPRTRGLVLVHPHNPTGAFLSRSDQEALGRLCRERDWAYISDEVFSEFAYPGGRVQDFVPEGALSFRLGGLSKSLGLPQLKLAWMVLDGPPAPLAECRERLELIADTYLSVNTPVQLALKDLFRFAPGFQKQMLERVLENRAALGRALQRLSGVKLWPAQGGWYALVEIQKKGARDEEIVLELLENHQVLVQPGGFYDFEGGTFLVLSLLPPPGVFQEGVEGLKKFFLANP
jgi:alanine-synthesizing transaminase